MQIYREALRADPAIAAAKANWEATQEKAPQARAGLLPIVSATAQREHLQLRPDVRSDPQSDINRNFRQYNASCRRRNRCSATRTCVLYDQSKQQVTQADYVLSSAQQDLIVRVAVAYFDILLAQFNIELAESQKKAVVEQLAQAKRNFEVGVATITDTNEAQAKYDAIVAQEITMRNEYDNRVTALRAIIGRYPRSEEARPGIRAGAARAQRRRLLGRPRAEGKPQRPHRREQLRDRQARGRSRQAAVIIRRSTWSAATRRRARTPRSSSTVASDYAHGHHRLAAQCADLPGRIRRFARARGHRAAGEIAAGPRGRAARGAVPGADRIHRRRQRHGVGEGVRAGRRVGGKRARVEHRSARKSACGRSSTCSTSSRTSIRRAAILRMPTSNI